MAHFLLLLLILLFFSFIRNNLWLSRKKKDSIGLLLLDSSNGIKTSQGQYGKTCFVAAASVSSWNINNNNETELT